MKIVFVLPTVHRTGGVRATIIVGNRLLARGHRVRIVYRRDRITLKGLYHRVFFPVLFPKSHEWLHTFDGESSNFLDISECYFDEDEIIIGAGMWASSQLCKLEGSPNIKLQYLHGEHIVDTNETIKVLKSGLPKIAVASFLSPLAESVGSRILEVVPNGVDTTEYFESVGSYQKDGLGAIYASHIAKDPETLLAVYKRLSAMYADVPWRIFSAHRRPRGIPKEYFWRLPSVSKARELYSKSFAWIVASKSEGFGMPILEAMACGCAVVATDCGGPRDIIKDGKNGFLVEVGNVKQIVDRVLLLLNDSDLREKICREGRRTVETFSWDRTVNRLEKVLERLAYAG